jgi:methyl-accepting chemotaxis protein
MKKKSLAFKLYTSIIILLSIILVTSIYTVTMIMKTSKFADETALSWLPSVDTAQRIVAKIVLLKSQQYELLTLTDKDEYLDQIVLINDTIKAINALIVIYETEITEAEEQAELQKFLPIWDEIKNFAQDIFKSAENNNEKEALNLIKIKSAPLFKKAESIFFEIADINYKGAIASTRRGNFFTELTVVGMIFIFSLSLFISFIIFRIINTSSKSIIFGIENLKSQSITTNDIANILKEGANSLSKTVIEQADAVLKTWAAVNQITSMVNRTSENSNESRKIAENATLTANDGQAIMQKLVSAMQNIQESNSKLQNIAEIIAQINSKTAMINDIVSKTELLSLNASIESARAGEHGKGFAVVAEEVGALAKISGKSANEIQELITKSQEQVNKILAITKERIDEGKSVTTEAQSAFQKIADYISSMTNAISQISDATKEQEVGVRQIAGSMGDIDKTTVYSKNAAETNLNSANKLVNESVKLDTTAKEIEVLIKGDI